IFRDPKERGRAIGIWAAVAAGGSSIGPVIGGFLLTHFWWGSVFLINVPVTIIAFIAGRFLLPKAKDPGAPPLGPVGRRRRVLGYSALAAGARMLPLAGVMTIVAPLSPRLVERVGTKIVVGCGLLLVVVGLGVASTTTASSGYPHLVLAMAVMASGMGLVMAP